MLSTACWPCGTPCSLAGIDDPVDAFQAFGVACVMFAVTHPAYFRVMYCAEVDGSAGPLAEAKEETMGMLIAGVEACQRAGVFPPGPPERLAIAAWSLVHGLSTLMVDGVMQRTTVPSADPKAVAEMVMGTLLGLSRAAPA